MQCWYPSDEIPWKSEFFVMYPPKLLGTGKVMMTAAHNPVLCHPQLLRPPAGPLGSSHTLILTTPGSVNRTRRPLVYEVVRSVSGWVCSLLGSEQMVGRLGRSSRDWGRGQGCAVAVLARTSQLKGIVKLVPEIAEFWEKINELFHVHWR